jgi:mannosyltransferase
LFQYPKESITHVTLKRVQGNNHQPFTKPSRLKSLFDQNGSYIALGLLFLVFGVRILNLSAPSLWLDEAVSANIAKKSVGEYLQWAKGDFHPPLYYLLLHLWSYLGHDEFTLRFFSVISSCFSGMILYFCVRKMFDHSTALLTLLLFTISPFQIRYSQEVRMYSLLGLWIVSILFFTSEYLRTRSWSFLLGYILFSTLGLYTHYHAGVFLTVLNVAVAIQLYRTEKIRLWQWFLAQSMISVLFAPWLSNFFHRFNGGGLSWFPFHPSFPLLISPLFSFLWGDLILSKVKHSLGAIIVGTGKPGPGIQWVLGIISILILLMIWRKRKKWIRVDGSIFFLVFLLVGTIGLSYGLSFRSNIYGAKYLFGVSFIFYILMAIVLIALSRFNRNFGIGLGLVIMIIQVFMLVAYYQPKNHRENWRGAVAYINSHSGSNQAVGFHFDEPMAPYAYYANDSIPAYGFLKEGDLSPSLLAVISGRNNALWLFDYLAELYDPNEKVKRKLLEHGYVPGQRHDFNGVPLTLWKRTTGSG